jgi:hypothetical protein
MGTQRIERHPPSMATVPAIKAGGMATDIDWAESNGAMGRQTT